ncbi:MAG TPA: DUF429 domain-containing protein [Candidatus Woesearchaeota archaeon]|nr:DUF429 domain-containing protein [Candidatus Woesearchaeota archaeon]
MRVVGINLAPNESEGTGIAEYDDGKVRTFTVYKNTDILEVVEKFKPEVVSIDAPLVVVDREYRSAEKELQAMGYDTIQVNRPHIRQLASRGSHLKYSLDSKTKIIECYVSLTKKSLNIFDCSQLSNVRVMNIIKNNHEKDAVFAAVTGVFYKEGLCKEFGDEQEGYIILPVIE